MEYSLLQKLIMALSWSRNSPPFMEPEIPLLSSYQYATGPYTEPD
jgi:hypothetical protein